MPSDTYAYLLWLPLLSSCLYLLRLRFLRQPYKAIPLVGSSPFEPRLLATWRFFRNAKSIVNGGYDKFKHRAYRFVRNDADLIVLPLSTLDELNALPWSIANPTGAHVHNLYGPHTGVDLLLRSDLHYRMIQRKLTPNLGAITGPMEQELALALAETFPRCEGDGADDEWVVIKPYDVLLKLVTRMSARVFVGVPFCRDERWLDISVNFTENIFVSVCLMRLFPNWMQPLLSLALPSLWRGRAYVRKAQALLGPEFARRLALADEKAQSPSTTTTTTTTADEKPAPPPTTTDDPSPGDNDDEDEEPTVLAWMASCATGAERSPPHLAHLEVILALASIHTTQMAALHALYDLAALPPAYAASLRAEILTEVARGWSKASYSRLTRLDSLLRESQRRSPPSVLAYHRLMLRAHTLADGTRLPSGAHICLAAHAVQNDAAHTEDPAAFDPLRAWRLRQAEGQAHLHQFSTTERTVLAFGHGKAACPGRWFASLEVKVLLVGVLMGWEVRLPGAEEGGGAGERPPNKVAHEFIFPDPGAVVEVRRRVGGVGEVGWPF